MGQGKYQMKVPHRQKLRGLLLQPPGFGQRLALGTVAVTAGVIGRALEAASIASIQMPTQTLESGRPKRPASLCDERRASDVCFGSSPRTYERYRPTQGALLLPPACD